MTYRVIFDYGDIEITIYHKTTETDEEKIADGAVDQLISRGFGTSDELYISIIEPCPEWDNED